MQVKASAWVVAWRPFWLPPLETIDTQQIIAKFQIFDSLSLTLFVEFEINV